MLSVLRIQADARSFGIAQQCPAAEQRLRKESHWLALVVNRCATPKICEPKGSHRDTAL
jgi:hypothetical protein